MLARTVRIKQDTAWCEVCCRHDLTDNLRYIQALRQRGSPIEFALQRGITFWTPPESLADHSVFERWLQISDQQRVRRGQITDRELQQITGDPNVAVASQEYHESPKHRHRDIAHTD